MASLPWKTARVALSSCLIAAVIAACGPNLIKESYRSSLERWSTGESSRLLPPSGRVAVLSSTNIEADATRMMEDGYLLLGRSKFQSEDVDVPAARDVARELGASVVLVKAAHAKRAKEIIPVERWIGPRGGGQSGADRNPGDSVLGEYRVTYIRRTVDYYDYSATFWAKSKPPIFGVLVEGTSGETTTTDPTGQSVTGKGVVIRAVIKGSPAAQLGLRRGDIVIRLAGADISNPDQFFDTVLANKGKTVEVDVVRPEGVQQLKLTVQLMNE